MTRQTTTLTRRPTPTSSPLSSGLLQRKCACGQRTIAGGECEECQKKGSPLQRRSTNRSEPSEVPPIVHEVLRSPGKPLDPATRTLMESRFRQNFSRVQNPIISQMTPTKLTLGQSGDKYEQEADHMADIAIRKPDRDPMAGLTSFSHYDFSQVRLHVDARAAKSARMVNALAYTVGRNIVFGTGQYEPQTHTGRLLIAHELAHVVQQGAVRGGQSVPITSSGVSVIQRQFEPGAADPLDDPRMHPAGAPKATKCAPPSWCPPGFCDPYSSESYAKHQRSKMALTLMAGIALAVDRRVVPLWRDYLWGGTGTKDLTGTFGKDFTNSKTTKKTTDFLVRALKNRLQATPPTIPPKTNTVTFDITSLIGSEIKEIDDPASSNRMNFNIPRDVAGNLAGGIGKDQLTCKAGAKPSPFNDERTAQGTANITRDGSGNLSVVPSITYTVKDTIDLCPGDCGTKLEQLATVPLSQFEATGISGDVPFTVEFPAPASSFTIPAKAASTP